MVPGYSNDQHPSFVLLKCLRKSGFIEINLVFFKTTLYHLWYFVDFLKYNLSIDLFTSELLLLKYLHF